MDEFLKMDIFFFVATLGVVVLTCCAAFVLWRLERVLKNIEQISKQVADEGAEIRRDLAGMRGEIQRGKNRVKAFFDFLKKFTKRTSKKS